MTTSETPSILLISNLFGAGSSYGGVCKELAFRLSSGGWQVTTTSALSNRLLRPLDMLATIWRTRRHYQIAHIDVFSGAAFRWAELSAWALRCLHKPYVLTLHGGKLPEFAIKHPIRVRWLLESASAVTTPSNYLLIEMTPYFNQIQLIPNPIDIQLYKFRARHQAEPRLLYLRALHKIYNPGLGVHVLDQLSSTYQQATLTIVGPDKGDGTAQTLRTVIEEKRLTDQVTLLGAIPKSEVPDMMEKADIFINTTNADNTPVSVIEAMACGLCVVSTNVGGIPYLLTNEHDALLVPPDDPNAMATAVERLLTEPGLAERISRNALTKVENFDWAIVHRQWEKLFLDIIAKASANSS